jgi:hypothetical protein
MAVTEKVPAKPKGFLKQRFRKIVLLLALQDNPEVGEALWKQRMLLAESLPVESQGLSVERLCQGGGLSVLKHIEEIRKRPSHRMMTDQERWNHVQRFAEYGRRLLFVANAASAAS